MRRTAIVLLLTSLLAGCGGPAPGGNGGPPGGEPVFPVTLGVITSGPLTEVTAIVGSVRWPKHVVLKSEVRGRVTAIGAEDGDRFDAGTVLVEIDARDYRLEQARLEGELRLAQSKLQQLKTGTRPEVIAALTASVQQMEAGVALAADDLNRVQRLVEQEVRTRSELTHAQAASAQATARLAQQEAEREEAVNGPTAEEFLIAEANVEVAEVNLQLAMRNVEKCRMSVPFAGIVLGKLVEVGAYVTPGEELVQVTSPDAVEAIFEVPERYVEATRDTASFAITADAIVGRSFEVRVAALIPLGDPGSRNFRLRPSVLASDGLLLPGMFVRGELPVAHQANALQAPADAIVLRADGAVVFVAAGASVRMVPVRTGMVGGGTVEVIGGLTVGDKVVTTGGEVLFPGARIADTAAGGSPRGRAPDALAEPAGGAEE